MYAGRTDGSAPTTRKGVFAPWERLGPVRPSPEWGEHTRPEHRLSSRPSHATPEKIAFFHPLPIGAVDIPIGIH